MPPWCFVGSSGRLDRLLLLLCDGDAACMLCYFLDGDAMAGWRDAKQMLISLRDTPETVYSLLSTVIFQYLFIVDLDSNRECLLLAILRPASTSAILAVTDRWG